MPTSFENFINTELPLRVATLDTPEALDIPVFTGVGRLTEAKTLAEAGIAKVEDLAAVATSGSYNDLSNKPTIPAAQVNADWGAGSGVAQILNKPTLGTAAAQNVGDFATAAQGTKADSALQAVSPAITAGTYGSMDKLVSLTLTAGGQASAVSEIVISTAYVASPFSGGNTKIGVSAQGSLTTGKTNTAVGSSSQSSVTSAIANTAVGARTQHDLTTGLGNTAVGAYSQTGVTTGNANTAVGTSSQGVLTIGTYNTAIGSWSQTAMTDGSRNTAIGSYAQHLLTTGSYNTCIGTNAGHDITSGSNNTIIGSAYGTASMSNNVILATSDTLGVIVAQHNATDWEMKGALFQNVTVGAAKTLTANSQLVVEVTSNSLLTFKLKGTDGVTRTATLSLV